MPRKEKKMESYNAKLKAQKGRIRVKDKNRDKEQGQQIENGNEYGRYCSSYDR